MTVSINSFKIAFINCTIIYFVYIAFRILLGKLNLKNYFKGDKVEITMRLIERLPWVILNLICAALAWVGLCIITILDLKFAANLIAVMLVIFFLGNSNKWDNTELKLFSNWKYESEEILNFFINKELQSIEYKKNGNSILIPISEIKSYEFRVKERSKWYESFRKAWSKTRER